MVVYQSFQVIIVIWKTCILKTFLKQLKMNYYIGSQSSKSGITGYTTQNYDINCGTWPNEENPKHDRMTRIEWKAVQIRKFRKMIVKNTPIRHTWVPAGDSIQSIVGKLVCKILSSKPQWWTMSQLLMLTLDKPSPDTHQLYCFVQWFRLHRL